MRTLMRTVINASFVDSSGKMFLPYFSQKRKICEITKVKENNTKCDFDYFVSEVETTNIPKNSKDEVKHIDVKIITTKMGRELIYQDFDNSIKLAVLNDDDEIEFIPVLELEEENEILCYDDKLKDYEIDEIKSIIYTHNTEELENKLARYVIMLDDAVIINEFIIK